MEKKPANEVRNKPLSLKISNLEKSMFRKVSKDYGKGSITDMIVKEVKFYKEHQEQQSNQTKIQP